MYSPEFLGTKTIVIVGEKIEGVYDKINIPEDFVSIRVIEGKDKICIPGFIDSHVHIIGGGGEGGFTTRTPEINIKTLIEAGITTVVGCLGTDSVCRNIQNLIAKANALEEEGITSYCYTGSYDLPVKTLMNSIEEDIMLINKVIGVGEVALSDDRSSQPTYEEFIRAVSQARVAGLLSGKSGIVNIHLGNGKRKIEYLFRLLEETEIPLTQLLPTHINRSKTLLEEGLKYVKKSGYIDLTTSCDPDHLEKDEVRASEGLAYLLKSKVDISHITFSSDGNGSLPIFENGKLIGIGICKVSSLFEEVREAVNTYNVPLEDAIKVITSNVAKFLKLKNKGSIEINKDADLVIINEEDLNIDIVLAKGKVVVEKGKAIIKSNFM